MLLTIEREAEGGNLQRYHFKKAFRSVFLTVWAAGGTELYEAERQQRVGWSLHAIQAYIWNDIKHVWDFKQRTVLAIHELKSFKSNWNKLLWNEIPHRELTRPKDNFPHLELENVPITNNHEAHLSPCGYFW